ncbi:hypothetical protein Scep_008682 [Stephania cephalantha]|uniref:Very-long-chain aldehyde decarbonylase CER1-like C-terminal domain-containing protein n=1 Tax=Stephania cephalantha TaxID=152367 RepID=A0AAP0KEW1_9MAGN
MTPREQRWAASGTHFHQFVVPPILRFRRDCTYGALAAMKLPQDVQGLGTTRWGEELFTPVMRGAWFTCWKVGPTMKLEPSTSTRSMWSGRLPSNTDYARSFINTHDIYCPDIIRKFQSAIRNPKITDLGSSRFHAVVHVRDLAACAPDAREFANAHPHIRAIGKFREWVFLPSDGSKGGVVVIWDPRKFKGMRSLLKEFSVTVQFSMDGEKEWWLMGVYDPSL